MTPEDGVLYTPEQVCEHGWLGPETTPGGLRRAAGRKRIEHTRYPPGSMRGRIYFTAANLRAIQEAGLESTGSVRRIAFSRSSRKKRTAGVELQPGVPLFQSRPDGRRRKAS